jgi:hypothetical protein
MCNYYKYNMPTFKEKSEVDDARVKSRHYDDLGLKTGWNFRYKAGRPCPGGRLELFLGFEQVTWPAEEPGSSLVLTS